MAAAKAQLEALQDDPELKALQDFESELRDVLAKHKRSLVDVNLILDENYKPPKAPSPARVAAAVAQPRPLKTWKNPHNGEVVNSSHGNHKTLNAWRDKWGVDVVKSWMN
ncbi:hypothetical protein D3C81_1907770 [compost metagenome]